MPTKQAGTLNSWHEIHTKVNNYKVFVFLIYCFLNVFSYCVHFLLLICSNLSICFHFVLVFFFLENCSCLNNMENKYPSREKDSGKKMTIEENNTD